MPASNAAWRMTCHFASADLRSTTSVIPGGMPVVRRPAARRAATRPESSGAAGFSGRSPSLRPVAG
eukprot:16441943-Heterocapsa_arctica.AAC.1